MQPTGSVGTRNKAAALPGSSNLSLQLQMNGTLVESLKKSKFYLKLNLLDND
jgi:hypothetical protein